MNPPISPDLASKVLAASTRNIVKDVGEGGKLTSADRKEMLAATISPDKAREARAQALLIKWASGGTLKPSDERELATYFPTALGRPPAPIEGADEPAADPGDAFALTGDTGRERLTRERLAKWQRIYNRQGRQLRRWHELGELHGDACPLDHPEQMVDWWERQRAAGRIKWRCPDEVLKAAQTARSTAPQETPSAIPTPSSETAPQQNAAPPPALPPAFSPIDISAIDPVEGDHVRQLMQAHAVKFQLMSEAMKAGRDYTALESQLEKLATSIDRMQTRAEDRARKRGLLIPRVAIERDIAAATEMLRQMRESMERRIAEQLGHVPPEVLDQVLAVVRNVRAAEDRVFHRLPSLKPPVNVEAELAA